jgi:hypothetical protein
MLLINIIWKRRIKMIDYYKVDYYKDLKIKHKSIKIAFADCPDEQLVYQGLKEHCKNDISYILIAYECRTCGYFPLRILKFKDFKLVENRWNG